ncbi:MAG: replication factor C large subunit [Candidatus Marsarchaeota archaeon]|jgi:replication factor C large subunit|nr:replication factor C large subunit [Candidatus Marsarchaeota archaeon]MCL5418987.1 replication factor C large subunit [Candidatus Marsarchaeota archaeon]
MLYGPVVSVASTLYINGLHDVESLDDIVGNAGAVKQLELYAHDIKAGIKRRPLLLYGPSGTGKTASAVLLAEKENWNVIEFNAGDYRDSDSITAKLIPAATSTSLFHKHSLILLDEIDELATRFDRGASSAVLKLIEDSRHPIIFTANDRWSQKISFLRDKVDYVEFAKIGKDYILKLLARVAKKNALHASEDNMSAVAQMSSGDARSAINDLFTIAGLEGDATELLGVRDRKTDIFNFLDHVFFASSFAGPLRALAEVDVQNDMLLNWLEENIPARYTHNDDIERAYSALAAASSFYNNASRSQYYTYWRYANSLMASGVALAKLHAPDNARRYAFPRVIKQLSATKLGRSKAMVIAAKLQRTLHSSRRHIVNNEMHVIASEARRAIADGTGKEELKEAMEYMYDLSADDQTYIIENF